MSDLLSGVSGSLFPIRYLADGLADPAGASGVSDLARTGRRLDAWWTRVAATCGPATGVRALVDVAAMPLFASLGYRARDAAFDRVSARARLETPRQSPVGLLVLPWASRPSGAWRDVVALTRTLGADWCFVFAPPFLSLIDARGHALRRSVDFRFPHVLDRRSLAALLTIATAATIEEAEPGRPGRIARIISDAEQFQDRVREDLQHGVVDAIGTLTRVLAGPAPTASAERFDEALTLIYRVLFLLFAESRNLVPTEHPIYRGAYALGSLCREAFEQPSAPGLWDALAAITRLSRTGCTTSDLIVRPFNGRLFARAAAPSLERTASRSSSRPAAARDAAMRHTLIALATRPGRSGREEISYADLGVEQLGAVYERVLDLELTDRRSTRAPARTRHSHRRKNSGTFYTPQSLAEFVVRRTLTPLVSGVSADAILDLRVVDPAMGSGAFLAAACRFLAAAYERALVDEGRAAETDLDDRERANIRRLVAERCLAGVDLNPVAVQLARLSLWLATLAHGKPLGFLDHRLRAGNSLIGASPDNLTLVSGRRRAAARSPLPLLDDGLLEDAMRQISRPLVELSARRDDSVEDVRAKEALWSSLSSDKSPLSRWRLAGSLWCARWFWPGQTPSPAETRAALDAILKNDATLRAGQLGPILSAAKDLDRTFRFFHWPLEFADVFYDEAGRPKEKPGFDAVIGNPPWAILRDSDRSLVRFVRESGLYPSCDRGHVNLYQPFLERALSLARAGGRVGLVLPWGLAADVGATALRTRLFDRTATDVIVGIDNAGGIFPVHRGLRFAVVVASPGGRTHEIRARFGIRSHAELEALPGDDCLSMENPAFPIRLSRPQLDRIGGVARIVPDARDDRDLALLDRLTSAYRRLGSSEGWHLQFGRELNATEDRCRFGPRGLPVIEGKHIRPFVADVGSSQVRIERAQAMARLAEGGFDRARLAYRDVSAVSNRLTLIAAIVPPGVVTTHTLFCLRTPLPLEQQQFLCALLNSYPINLVARMLMGGHLTTSLVESLPAPTWENTAAQRRVARFSRRMSERPDARTGALLQAAVARLYGLDGSDFRHVLDRFPLVPRDERDLAYQRFIA